MRIAIVGTGIAGMTAAYLLRQGHEIVVFEANDRIGGHTHTVDAEQDGRRHAVDTGFIVFNDWTYPNFIRLLDRLGVESQPSEMSFSVRAEASGLEYCGSNLNGLFAQRSNLAKPAFYGMLGEIVRFNREAKHFIRNGPSAETMAEYLRARNYSNAMGENYLVPMMAAIWSSDPAHVREFPAKHYLQFFENHGLLNVVKRPQWRVIKGGSREYAKKLVAPFLDKIRLSSPIESIRRGPDGVIVKPRGAEAERFDHVVIAAHSDQALAMLDDPTDAEREILGAIGYQRNGVVLHTDEALMPKRRRAWASWNYHLPHEGAERATLTYNMNILQSLETPKPFLVTLNRGGQIAKEERIQDFVYDHPVFSGAAVAAQARHAEISGADRTHYCGAYWGYGFHEDGVKSALEVCKRFGAGL